MESAQGTAQVQVTDATSESVSRPPRILLADDEGTFLDATAELLRREGYECHCAPDGDTAIALAEAHEFDAIVADIKMPGNRELEMLQTLRERGGDAALIIATGYPSLDTAVRSLELSVSTYLVKPFEIEELLKAIDTAVPQVRALRRIRELGKRMRDWSEDFEAVGSSTAAGRGGIQGDPTTTMVDITFGGVMGALAELKGVLSELAEGKSEEARRRLLGQGRLRVITDSRLAQNSKLKELSPREREVLLLLGDGNRVSTIAREMEISPHTVRNHLKSVFAKTGLRSQSELIDWFKGHRYEGA